MDFAAIEYVLRQGYQNVDGLEIKSRVDDLGIKAFIASCAKRSASTGFAAGFGGGPTLAVLIGVDVANYLYQQIRVTLGVIYHRSGRYQASFEEVMTYMAVALGVRVAGAAAAYISIQAGVAITNKVSHQQLTRLVIQHMLKQLPASATAKVIPGVGGVFGAGFNYVTLRGYGNALLKVDEALFS